MTIDNSRKVHVQAYFIGTRLEALQALQRYAKVSSIITIEGSRVHYHCQSNNVPVHLVDKKTKNDLFRQLAVGTAPLVLSAGFPFILPTTVLTNGSVFINSHPALLPKYKGYNSIRNSYKNSEEFMGVTVHIMTEEVDAGPFIHQERIWVKGMSLQTIYQLLFSVVEPFAISKALETYYQDHCKNI